jgi:hypothetical protein
MPAWPELPVPVDELVVCWALAGGSLAWWGVACQYACMSNIFLRLALLSETAVVVCAESGEYCMGSTYTALEVADKKALEDLAGFVTVADVLEGFGREGLPHHRGARLRSLRSARVVSVGLMVRSLWRFRWSGWVLVRLSVRHTGAVVDLIVDDHVEVFLWEVSVP